jgi:hypothetical protein
LISSNNELAEEICSSIPDEPNELFSKYEYFWQEISTSSSDEIKSTKKV